MANFTLDDSAWILGTIDGTEEKLLRKPVLDAFNSQILGLGDLRSRSVPVPALAAVFDLEGFTTFCTQIEPHLSVPAYLGKFIPWLLARIKKETIQGEAPEGVHLWHPLPFFTKFMGDGLIVLWETQSMGPTELENLIVSLHTICTQYERDLYAELKSIVVDPPKKLRCGVARGTVFSVGDQADYVGSCINMAARIQKLPGVQFTFNRRGFDLEHEGVNDYIKKRFVIKKVSVRGIGDGELLGILASDLQAMPPDDQILYQEP